MQAETLQGLHHGMTIPIAQPVSSLFLPIIILFELLTLADVLFQDSLSSKGKSCTIKLLVTAGFRAHINNNTTLHKYYNMKNSMVLLVEKKGIHSKYILSNYIYIYFSRATH